MKGPYLKKVVEKRIIFEKVLSSNSTILLHSPYKVTLLFGTAMFDCSEYKILSFVNISQNKINLALFKAFMLITPIFVKKKLIIFVVLKHFLFPTSSLVPPWAGGFVPSEKTYWQSTFPAPCAVHCPLF